MEILSTIFSICIFLFGLWFVISSSKAISEKKYRRKNGISDYYDELI